LIVNITHGIMSIIVITVMRVVDLLY